MQSNLPHIGMRNIKTTVAVLICFFIFLPFQQFADSGDSNPLSLMGPFYACISSIICMQGSVSQSVRQGVARLLGTVLGGILGLLLLLPLDLYYQGWLLGLLLGLGVMVTIWLCLLIHQPAACAIGCVVLCVVMLNHGGTDRYLYTLIRMGQTAVGILVAVAVNRLLPDHQQTETKNPST